MKKYLFKTYLMMITILMLKIVDKTLPLTPLHTRTLSITTHNLMEHRAKLIIILQLLIIRMLLKITLTQRLTFHRLLRMITTIYLIQYLMKLTLKGERLKLGGINLADSLLTTTQQLTPKITLIALLKRLKCRAYLIRVMFIQVNPR